MHSDTESARGSDESDNEEEEVEQWDEDADDDEEKKPLCMCVDSIGCWSTCR